MKEIVICDIGRHKWDLFDVVDILEVASLYREEPELDAVFFNDDGERNNLTFLANFFLIWYFWIIWITCGIFNV
jgi:hypothetical protein